MPTLDEWVLYSTGNWTGGNLNFNTPEYQSWLAPQGASYLQNYYNKNIKGNYYYTDKYPTAAWLSYGDPGPNNTFQYNFVRSKATAAEASKYGWKAPSATDYWTQQYGTNFDDARIAQARDAYMNSFWQNEDAVKWALYKSGGLLGADANQGNFESQLISDYDNYTYKNYSTDSVNYKPGNLTRYQKAMWDAYYARIPKSGAYDPNDVYPALARDFGLPNKTYVNNGYTGSRPYQPIDFESITREQASRWYKSPTIDTITQLYDKQYGTTTIDPADIPRAQDIVYGEVVPTQDLGEGWKDLWDTYKQWQAQDEQWYKSARELYGITEGAENIARAQMAAGGMQTGSKLWQDRQAEIGRLRGQIDTEYEEKKQALKGTSVYQALENQYKKMYRDPEIRSKIKPETAYRDVLIKEAYTKPGYWTSVPRYDSVTGTTYYEDVYRPPESVPAQYGREAYTVYKEAPTETGRLLYGTGENKDIAPTMDEFFAQNFGERQYDPTVSYDVTTTTTEDENTIRARMLAGGANFDI